MGEPEERRQPIDTRFLRTTDLIDLAMRFDEPEPGYR